MAKSERCGRAFSSIFFNLHNFKSVNDTHGHDCGDGVVGATERVLRSTDRLGRWGGEEFVVLAPETDLRKANRLAECLRVEIANHRSGSTPMVTASLGLAQ